MRRLIALSLVLLSSSYASACCGITAAGMLVEFGRQLNLIIWDPATKTQHFIRSAAFEANAKDFGFLAPTPSVPKLSVAELDVFDTLSREQPRSGQLACAKSEDAAMATGSAVDVIQQVQIGDYLATTLKATDSKALADYLRKMKYVLTPDSEAWLGVYIKKQWYITAFQVKVQEGSVAETQAIRMSFQTDRPFNPYYVPASNIGQNPSGLDVYILSPKPLLGSFNLEGRGQAWETPQWSTDLEPSTIPTIAKHIGLTEKDLPSGLILASFTDPGFPVKGAGDIFFREVSRKEIGLGMHPRANLILWTSAIVLYGVAMTWFFRRRRAIRRQSQG